MRALGIAEESPQPDEGGARTWNVKPDPSGNAQIIFTKKAYQHKLIGSLQRKSLS